MSLTPDSNDCAILLVDHGSRRTEANALVEEVAAAVRKSHPDWHVAFAHLELAPPDVPTGLDACVAAGAKTVVVHPYFLGPGRHSRDDLPALLADARARHPGVEFVLSEPLGPHPKLTEVVLDRIAACLPR